jgi:hypothetical protein
MYYILRITKVSNPRIPPINNEQQAAGPATTDSLLLPVTDIGYALSSSRWVYIDYFDPHWYHGWLDSVGVGFVRIHAPLRHRMVVQPWVEFTWGGTHTVLQTGASGWGSHTLTQAATVVGCVLFAFP